MGLSSSRLSNAQKDEIINALDEARIAYNKAIFIYYRDIAFTDYKSLFLTVLNLSADEIGTGRVTSFPRLKNGGSWTWADRRTITNDDLTSLCYNIYNQLANIKHAVNLYNIKLRRRGADQYMFTLPIVKFPVFCNMPNNFLEG